MKNICGVAKPGATAREDFMDVFNLICKHGQLSRETRTSAYFTLDGVTAGDNGVNRSLSQGSGVIQEPPSGQNFGYLQFTGMTEAELNRIATQLRHKYTA